MLSGVFTKGRCCHVLFLHMFTIVHPIFPYFSMDTMGTPWEPQWFQQVWKMCYSDLLPERAMSTLRGAHGVERLITTPKQKSMAETYDDYGTCWKLLEAVGSCWNVNGMALGHHIRIRL